MTELYVAMIYGGQCIPFLEVPRANLDILNQFTLHLNVVQPRNELKRTKITTDRATRLTFLSALDQQWQSEKDIRKLFIPGLIFERTVTLHFQLTLVTHIFIAKCLSFRPAAAYIQWSFGDPKVLNVIPNLELPKRCNDVLDRVQYMLQAVQTQLMPLSLQ